MHLKVCRVTWLDLARWKPSGREACADAAPAHIICRTFKLMGKFVHNRMIVLNYTCIAGRASSMAQCRSTDSVGAHAVALYEDTRAMLPEGWWMANPFLGTVVLSAS